MTTATYQETYHTCQLKQINEQKKKIMELQLKINYEIMMKERAEVSLKKLISTNEK